MCDLLHERSTKDPRPTRIFSDSDCRTHSLHLRRDSKEDTLDLCKQLGWKVPQNYAPPPHPTKKVALLRFLFYL